MVPKDCDTCILFFMQKCRLVNGVPMKEARRTQKALAVQNPLCVSILWYFTHTHTHTHTRACVSTYISLSLWPFVPLSPHPQSYLNLLQLTGWSVQTVAINQSVLLAMRIHDMIIPSHKLLHVQHRVDKSILYLMSEALLLNPSSMIKHPQKLTSGSCLYSSLIIAIPFFCNLFPPLSGPAIFQPVYIGI